MTTSTEQEAFSFVIDHQKSGAPENDIQYASMQFINTAANPGRTDLYVHNTHIHSKADAPALGGYFA